MIDYVSFERGQNRLRCRRFYPPSSFPRLPGFLVPLVGESMAVPTGGQAVVGCFGQSGRVWICPPQAGVVCAVRRCGIFDAVHRLRGASVRFAPARSRAALRRSARMLRFYLYVGEGRRKPSQAPKFSSSPPEPTPSLSLAGRASVKFAKKGAGRYAAAVNGQKR